MSVNATSKSPFLVKTYEMVDDPSTDSVVSWGPGGITFVVWNPPEFSRDMLPMYFKHNNFSSFIRQLNTYGFRKVDPHRWEFANEEFVRGQRHLLKNINRRKPPIHSHHANVGPLTDEERVEFEQTVQSLERDKRSLQSELEMRERENREYKSQLRSLEQRLQSIDRRLTSTVISLDQNQNKKRRLLSHHREEVDLEASPSLLIPRLINTNDLVESLDSCLRFWDELMIDEIPEYSCDNWAAATPDESPPIPISSVSSTEGGANDLFWQQFLTEDPDYSSVEDRSGLTNYQQNKHRWVHVDNHRVHSG